MSRRKSNTFEPSAQLDGNSPVPADDAPKRRRRQVDGSAEQSDVAQSPEPTTTKPKTTPRRRKRATDTPEAGAEAPEPLPSDTATTASAEAASATAPSPAGASSAETDPSPADSATTATTAPPAKRSRKKPKPEPLPVYSQEMRPPPWKGPAFRILSWNVAGLRALMKKDKDVLARLAEQEEADVICLQETKLQDSHVSTLQALVQLPGWHMYWSCSSAKAGYAGTAVLSRAKPLSVQYGMGLPSHDDEGRVITAEYPDLYVVDVYTPNSSEGLKRLDYRVQEWDIAFRDHVKALEASGKAVVVTGDLNCAHHEIDIHSPKTNLRSAGFTVEERDSFTKCFTENGLVDTWRAQHPGVVGYSYWTYKFGCRAKNKGWRLDYFLVSESLSSRVHDSYMLQDVMGSDHCPLGLVIKLAAAA